MVHGFFFGDILAGLADAADEAGGRVVAIQTCEAGLRPRTGDEQPFTPVAWEHIDAFAVCMDAVSDGYVQALSDAGKPVVLICREIEDLRCPVVLPDNRGGIVAAIDHLVEHGHQRIAYASRDPAIRDDEIRFATYQDELRSRGLKEYTPITIDGYYASSPARMREATQQLLAENPRPTAIVCVTDAIALCMMDAFQQAGVNVPGDIAVTGFDDIAEAATHEPSLSTIAQNCPMLGRIAGDLLFEALAGHPVRPGYHCAPVQLVTRESCGCLVLHGAGSGGAISARATEGDDEDRFVSDFIAAIQVSGDQTRTRMRDIEGVGRTVHDLFVGAVDELVTDLAARIASVAAEVYRVAPQDTSMLNFAKLVHRFARMLGARLVVPDDVSARLSELADDLAMAVVQRSMRSRPAEYLRVWYVAQRTHYKISTEILGEDHEKARKIGWLAETQARAGCLAIWDGRQRNPDGSGGLRILGTYDDGGAFPLVDECCDVRSFPPARMLDLIGTRADDIMYLLPVRFGDSDWGFLALIGSLEIRFGTAIEMFNHWAVMLTVGLDQEQATRELRTSEERYALAAAAANDGLWDWDLTSGVVFYSRRWRSLLGLTDEDVGSTIDEFRRRIHIDDGPTFAQVIAEQLAGQASTLELECRMETGDGTYRWTLVRARSVRGNDGRVTRMVGSMTDITDRKLLEERLRHDALHDPLTGLPNRALLLDRLDQAIERTRRQREDWFAVVFIDLNGFKDINDRWGHQAGDEVIISVADRLGKRVRAGDTVGRFGGDEFVVVLGGMQSVEDVSTAVDRIIEVISEPIPWAGQELTVGAAVGIALCPAGEESADELLRNADAAMYRAKALGRTGEGNVSVVFEQSERASTPTRLSCPEPDAQYRRSTTGS